MASSPVALTPPPDASSGPQQPPPSPAAPTAPAAASPSPPQPAPAMQQGTQLAIQVVSNLRSIAKAFPATAPHIAEINNVMRSVMASMMQHAQTVEPKAPPTGG